jgi:nitrate reductase NapE component
MLEQPVESQAVVAPLSAEEQALLDQKQAKRRKTELISFAIMAIGFVTLLIPNPITGKYGEYTMFAGAILYFSGRFRK